MLSVFVHSETFAAWRRRYRIQHSVTQTEITVEIEPFPPDTFDSVYAEMTEKELQRLGKEFISNGIAVQIDHEQCALFGNTFHFSIRPTS